MARISLVSFYTEGPSHDHGLSLEASAKKLEEVVAPHVDSLYLHTPRTLTGDPWWDAHFKVYNEPEMELPRNPCASKCGFFKFKPLCLLRAMEKEPDGTLIMYIDANVNKVTDYLKGIEDIKENAEAVLRRCGADIWISYELPNQFRVKHYCKAFTIHKMVPNEFVNSILNRSMLLCCRILVRNTPEMRNMLQNELLPFFENDELLAPIPKTHNDPALRWHTGDQGVWNAFLFHKVYKGELPRNWPLVWCGRAFTRESIKKEHEEY